MRSILTATPASDATVTVTDMEAGIEHLSRGTTRDTDIMLIVAEPYYKSLETAARVRKMADELGIKHTYIVANKVRSETDSHAIQDFCERQSLQVIATIPYDEELVAASMIPVSPLDHRPDSTGALAVKDLADILAKLHLN